MSITTRHISNFIERWAPNQTKLDYDNTGLLAGDPDKEIKKLLTCLDVTPAVIDEAVKNGTDLILAHHPLIFPKITRINESDPVGKMLRSLIRHDIDLIAAHTNLDAARNGVSFELARVLGLEQTQFLHAGYDSLRLLVLRSPNSVREKVEAFLETQQLDTGWSSEENNVSVARFNLDKHRLNAFEHQLSKTLDGFPYTLDVLPVDSKSPEFGFGVMGSLSESMDSQVFLSHVNDRLSCRAMRFSGNAGQIKKVAVCGGAGASMIGRAFGAGADAYVTGDIKYHEYFVPEGKLLIDAGHYETEAPVIGKMAEELSSAFPELDIQSTTINTNPMFGFQAAGKQNFIKKQNHH